MIRRDVMLLVALAALVLAAPSAALAQKNCKKGIPCGNTCISAAKTCRIGGGTTRSAEPSFTTKAADALAGSYVASSRGTVYYLSSCSAAKKLSIANRIYFNSAKQAEAQGYKPSRSAGCSAVTPATDDTAASKDSSSIVSIENACGVARITDGDTFVCEDGRKVRLLLIDAPEMTQGDFGKLARDYLAELLPLGQVVKLDFDVQKQDRYGRSLAYVSLNRVNVNREMARAGMAVVSVYQPNVAQVDLLRAAADSAKAEKRGLWSGSAFECNPADYRAGRCR